MKLLVETTGPFLVYTALPEQSVEADRPGVVTPTSFINRAMADGRLTMLAQLADTATDADFLETWVSADGDRTLAVESYISQHPYDDAAKQVDVAKAADATTKPRGGRSKKEVEA